jgi:hypothetical protein
LVAPLFAGVGFYLLEWRDVVSKQEMEKAISGQPYPYLAERGVIFLRLERLEAAQVSVDKKLDEILHEVRNR